MEREKEYIMVRRISTKTGIIFIIIILAAVLFSSCENSLDSYIEKDELQAQKADILAAPGINITGNVITGHEEIILYFNESIDTATLSLSGDLGDLSPATYWDQTSYADDTLYINNTNLQIWPEGDDKSLTVSCVSASGKVLTGYTFNRDVFYGTCVDDSAASGGNGTVMHPFQTVQDGIDNADLWYSGDTVVRIAEGSGTNYQSNYNTSGGEPVIDMINKVSVRGGYNSTFSIWDPDTYETKIEDTSTAGDHNRAINIPSSIDSTTVLSGLTIKLGEGNSNRGISCEGSPQIENNIITGCLTEPYETCYTQRGIYISGASANPEINDNSINPGFNYSGDISTSCAIESINGSGPDIHDNVIDGGSGFWTYGIILNFTGSIIIENNTIDTGYADLGATDYAYAIHITGSSPVILNNVLTSSTSTATKYGIYEHNDSSDPAQVRGNDFNFTSDFWYWDEGTTSVGELNYDSVQVSTVEGTDYLFNPLNWNNKSTAEGIN